VQTTRVFGGVRLGDSARNVRPDGGDGAGDPGADAVGDWVERDGGDGEVVGAGAAGVRLAVVTMPGQQNREKIPMS
jgi:hypothetical protein